MFKNLKQLLICCFVSSLLCSFAVPAVNAAKPDNTYIPGWIIEWGEDGKADTKGEATIDQTEKHTGERAVKLVFNSSYASNRFVRLKSEAVPLKANTQYKIEFWAKLGASSRRVTVKFNKASERYKLTDADGKTVTSDFSTTSGVDWTHYEYTYTPTANADDKLMFFLEGTAVNGVWIDDVTVRRCDAEGNAVGENMLANPGFEHVQALEPIAMNGWEATFTNNLATASAPNYAAGEAAILPRQDGTGQALFAKFPMIKMTNRYMTIKSTPMEFDAAKTYKWELDLKSADLSRVGVRVGWNVDRVNFTPETDGWAHYGEICTPAGKLSGTQSLLIIIENYAPSGIWIDNAAVYECDANGTQIGENMLANPDFEGEAELAEVEDVKVSYDESAVVFSWVNPKSANYTAVRLYALDGASNATLAASAEATQTSVTLSDVTDLSKRQYIIKTADAAKESQGVRIAPYTVSKLGFDLLESAEPSGNGTFTVKKADLTKLESGYLRARVSIANNYMGDGFQPGLLVALYDGDKLCAVQTVSSIIEEGEFLNAAPAELGLVSTVPALEGGTYRVKAFVWEAESLTPLSDNAPALSEQ